MRDESAASSRELAEARAALDESVKAVRHLRKELHTTNKGLIYSDAQTDAAISMAREYGFELGKTREEMDNEFHKRHETILIEQGHGDFINDTSFLNT